MDVEFEPVRLGARRRRLDPVALGALVVTVAVAISVVKPWDAADSSGAVFAPAASVPVGAVATQPATPGTAIPRIISASSRSSAGWSEIKPVVRRHDAWGMRAIVMDRGALRERWFRFPAGGTEMSTAFLDTDDVIVALGVTFPPAQTPLDVRVWRETSQGLDWVDTEALEAAPSGGAFLYGRLPIFGNVKRTWIPGTYRMDVLVDGSVRRLGIAIANRFSNVPAGSERPNLRDARPAAERPDPSMVDLPPGLFATAEGTVVPLPADEGPALDEVGAWLNVDPGTGRAPRSFVAEVYLPNVTTLGVMLESPSRVRSAAIERLAPEPITMVVPEFDVDSSDGQLGSVVRFHAPDARVWTPGSYRITVAWDERDGLHEESWHVALRPGPTRPSAPLLSAIRAWARYAGDTGIIRGTAEPLEGGPRSATIRLERATPGEGAGYPLRDRRPCDGFRVDGPAGLFGVAQPVDAPPSAVTARAHFEYSQSDAQPILTSSGNLPGLVIVATDGAAAPISLAHRYRVGEDLDSTWSSLCVEVH